MEIKLSAEAREFRGRTEYFEHALRQVADCRVIGWLVDRIGDIKREEVTGVDELVDVRKAYMVGVEQVCVDPFLLGCGGVCSGASVFRASAD